MTIDQAVQAEEFARECSWGPLYGQCAAPADPRDRKGRCAFHVAIDRQDAARKGWTR